MHAAQELEQRATSRLASLAPLQNALITHMSDLERRADVSHATYGIVPTRRAPCDLDGSVSAHLESRDREVQ
jgi:hypothetical protein